MSWIKAGPNRSIGEAVDQLPLTLRVEMNQPALASLPMLREYRHPVSRCGVDRLPLVHATLANLSATMLLPVGVLVMAAVSL